MKNNKKIKCACGCGAEIYEWDKWYRKRRFKRGHHPHKISRNEDHGAWKGDGAGYAAKHMWIRYYWGKANKCEFCATKKAKKYEWANKSRKYKRKRSDWLQLCASCHRKYDIKSYRGTHCKRGHQFTSENTYISKEGWQVCRKCRRISWHKNKNGRERNGKSEGIYINSRRDS